MNEPSPFRAPVSGKRHSKAVTLVILGAIGLGGGLAAWDARQRSREETDIAAPAPAPSAVSADETYDNNYYLPGAGYYHASHYAWFPFPYNYHDPARGYYGGGRWSALPLALALTRSQPHAAAVAEANAALLAGRQEEERKYQANRSSGGAGYRSGSWSRSNGSSSGSSGGSIHRGGFGSSGRSFGSGS